jgi:hypothetical protein
MRINTCMSAVQDSASGCQRSALCAGAVVVLGPAGLFVTEVCNSLALAFSNITLPRNDHVDFDSCSSIQIFAATSDKRTSAWASLHPTPRMKQKQVLSCPLAK